MRVLIALGGNAMTGPDGSATPQAQREAIAAREPPPRRARRRRPRGRRHPRQRPPGRQPPRQERARRPRRPAGPARLVRRPDAGDHRLHAARHPRGRASPRAALERRVAAIVTRTLVDRRRPRVHHTRPSRSAASSPTTRPRPLIEHGERWQDRGEKGWRRVVASPEPLEVLETHTAPHPPRRAATSSSRPVAAASRSSAQPDGAVHGVEAVIDKDLTAALLARAVGADVLVIATDVEHAVARLRHPGRPATSAGSRSPRWRRMPRPASSRPARWAPRSRRPCGSSAAAVVAASSPPSTSIADAVYGDVGTVIEPATAAPCNPRNPTGR